MLDYLLRMENKYFLRSLLEIIMQMHSSSACCGGQNFHMLLLLSGFEVCPINSSIIAEPAKMPIFNGDQIIYITYR